MTITDLVVENGSTRYPHENWYARWPEDFAFAAEAWEKYDDPAEHRRIMQRRHLVECRTCRAQLQDKAVQRHGREAHPGENVSFDYVHALWTYQLLGFPELWWGNPRGWFTILDGRDAKARAWEYDCIELGTRVAEELWA